MKVFLCQGSSLKALKTGQIRWDCLQGGYIYSQDRLDLIDYDYCNISSYFFDTDGELLVGYSPFDVNIEAWNSFNDKTIAFKYADGSNYESLDKLAAYMLMRGKRVGDYSLSRIQKFSSSKSKEIILYNHKDSNYILFKNNRYIPYLFSDTVFFNKGVGGYELSAFNFDGKLRWKHCYESDWPSRRIVNNRPIVASDKLIINLRSEKGREGKSALYKNGEVYCFNLRTGEVLWKRIFEWQVEEIDLLDDQHLAVCSGTSLYVLDIVTGDIIKEKETGLALQFLSLIMCVFDQYIYLSSDKYKSISIFDKESLQLLHQEDVSRLNALNQKPKYVAGKLFVNVKFSHLWATLVIDPKDIHAPLEIEQGPERSISTPNSNNGAIVIAMTSDNLSDVIRFTEWEGLNAVHQHGDNGLGGDKTPEFNGQVLLRYSGFREEQRAEIEDKLSLLKRRFDYFANERYQLSSGSGREAICFEYELV